MKTATNSGIAVISTVRASTTPMSPPSASPLRIMGQDRISCRNSVATTATSMPSDASALPVRAVTGDCMRLSPKIKSTAEAKYARSMIAVFIGKTVRRRVYRER